MAPRLEKKLPPTLKSMCALKPLFTHYTQHTRLSAAPYSSVQNFKRAGISTIKFISAVENQ